MIVMVLVVPACSTLANSNPGPTKTPPAIADSGIVAEGHLEPIHFTELALNASGLVSEVLFKEGDKVAAGDVIARLKSNEAKTLESAQSAAAEELTTAFQGVRDAQYKLDNFDVPSDFNGMTPTQAVDEMLVRLNKARADLNPIRTSAIKLWSQARLRRKAGSFQEALKSTKKHWMMPGRVIARRSCGLNLLQLYRMQIHV